MTSRAAVGSAALFFGEGSNERLQRFGGGTCEKTGAYYGEHNNKNSLGQVKKQPTELKGLQMTVDNMELETYDTERRRYHRVAANNPITYVLVNERGSKIGQGIGKVINVSQSGILLETYEFIESKYLFLVSTDVEDKLIEIVGKVIFSREVCLCVFNSGSEGT
jgi:hypothetical protein